MTASKIEWTDRSDDLKTSLHRGMRCSFSFLQPSANIQCAAAGVPFFFKQWGHWNHESNRACAGFTHVHQWPDCSLSYPMGKKAAGRLLDGVEHNGMPT